jgi:hypothetical protein
MDGEVNRASEEFENIMISRVDKEHTDWPLFDNYPGQTLGSRANSRRNT